ncbi:hypothetical protein O181_084773 [Austropuccinia psidii MF-1]|uniref:Uncharacterized protein n=1 Tax=Austropuccinia psidii MF-1 TaxID=1389203 RepID=A0A9Q3FRY1_9BASI|nr:hypothetical protein [Austropuccinia psidii MF-1]
MVRQANLETASIVTSIIPASTVNSDNKITVIITQNNQPEPIYSEVINLDISNTVQKAKDLADNQEPAITPQAASRKVIDVIKAEADQLQKGKAQRVPDPCRSVEKLHEFLPDCDKIPGPSQHLQVTQWMEKKNMMLLTAEWRKNSPPPPKQVPKTAPVASNRNSNVKEQPQAQNKGKGKAPATKPYSQGYRIPNIQQDAMENVFQMARTILELQKKRGSQIKI